MRPESHYCPLLPRLIHVDGAWQCFHDLVSILNLTSDLDLASLAGERLRCSGAVNGTARDKMDTRNVMDALTTIGTATAQARTALSLPCASEHVAQV